MEVSYSAVTGTLSITPQQGASHSDLPPQHQEPTGCLLLFSGVGLTQEGLKDWLRLCVKQVQSRPLQNSEMPFEQVVIKQPQP